MTRQILVAFTAMCMLAMAYGQSPPKIVKFSPDGGGMWEPYTENSKHYVYYRSKDHPERTISGVWSASSHHVPKRTWVISELCYVLEGRVVLTDKLGKDSVFGPGEVFFIPRGTEMSWKSSNDVKLYYWEFEPDAPSRVAANEDSKFFKLDPAGASVGGLKTASSGRSKEAVFYSGSDGSTLGVWETEPTSYDSPARRYAEVMIILKGEVTLSTPDGWSEKFRAGDVALIPKGISYHWTSDAVSKYWLSFDNTNSDNTQ